MKIAVCDDNELAAFRVKEMVEKIEKENEKSTVCDMYTNEKEMLYSFESGENYDVVIMDIDWDGEGLGIRNAEILRRISPATRIIYMTGYTQKYVEQIFLKPSNLSGFLMKPVSEESLRENLRKAMDGQGETSRKRFIFQQQGNTYAVDFQDILYLESYAHRILIITETQEFYCYGKLDELEKEFPEEFLRCHHSYFVNMERVRAFEKNCLVLEKGEDMVEIPVSKRKYRDAKEQYFSYSRKKLFAGQKPITEG